MSRLITRFRFSAACVVLAILFVPASTHAQLLGFSDESSAMQRDLEADYDSQLNADNLDEWLQYLTRHPTHVGSPGGKANAEWIADKFRSWGFETRIDTYHVMFPTPRERMVELVSPNRYVLKLEEPEVEGDRTSGITQDLLPTYNAYSADGDVEGEVVYVNYGIPADYDELARHGISVEGKIALARYGGSWRGIKPKVAAQHGAIATLIYSDPRDDGYFQGDVYPDGPYRMAQGAQRGSVEDMPQYPGDPLTPGVGATLDAERYTVEESPTIMKIPVLPISYEDAQPILAAMGGPVAPAAWRGALPLTYHLGPGPARVHMKLEFNWDLTPAYDVIAMLPGSEFPDEWVVRGNHMDGWAFGAGDPLSGMVALMEEARAVGEMVKNGWRPKRTIVYAGWDAEEPGLLGSTEWAEDHAAELQDKAVVYINSDGNGRGFVGVGGSHTLERLANELGDEVIDPQTGISVNDRLKHARAVDGAADVYTRRDRRIGPLGSGSDYTPFLQHLGIASLNIGFGGENGGGSYHSIFDSYDHYSRFGDPGFAYGITLAKTAGRATLRMANADVLPFRFGNFADNVQMYLGEVKQLAASMRTETELHNRLVENDSYEIASDPTKTYVPPEAKEPVPHINFAPVENAVARLEAAAARYDELMASAVSQGLLGGGTGERLNNLLQGMEQRMTREEGLPRRPWFRHMIYAPGFWTGYGVKTLPGIREGLEERAWDEVDMFVDEVAAALNRVSDGLDQAAALLSAAEPG
ncbi:MAG: M28 family peptidase [Gemmatimonadales bacterium]|nr:M28 family peptidase [Gemmatimonadales bacterium]MDG2241229.1 transferrin receptor-like dimerization domain-containing protein [Longimicrobiales bacterium]MBT3498248.1 M28 family peptidase [Gemmatimonadales bacterium]MBT3773667.1 M28 family peptidase [Gemmatimonadales bacterium]MBT3959593.1 M28 family peptidase [Gemmatimonadales bacterium]